VVLLRGLAFWYSFVIVAAVVYCLWVMTWVPWWFAALPCWCLGLWGVESAECWQCLALLSLLPRSSVVASSC
jgi:hypothetical protein